MTLLEFAAMTLAASAIVDAWFNGSIFEHSRAVAEADLAAFNEGYWHRFFSAARACVYCFSYHATWYLAPAFVLAAFLANPWRELVLLPVYCLAATRLNFLIDAWLPASMRYARFAATRSEPGPDAGGDLWPDTQPAGTATTTTTPTKNDGGGAR